MEPFSMLNGCYFKALRAPKSSEILVSEKAGLKKGKGHSLGHYHSQMQACCSAGQHSWTLRSAESALWGMAPSLKEGKAFGERLSSSFLLPKTGTDEGTSPNTREDLNFGLWNNLIHGIGDWTFFGSVRKKFFSYFSAGQAISGERNYICILTWQLMQCNIITNVRQILVP